MAIAAGVEIIYQRGVLGNHTDLLCWIGNDSVGGGQTVDDDIGFVVVHRKAGNFGFVSNTHGSVLPAGMIEPRLNPRVAQRAIDRYQHPRRCGLGQEYIRGDGLADSVRNVPELFRELRGKRRDDRAAARTHQRQILTGSAQIETRVKGRAGNRTVLARGENQQEPFGGDGHVGEPPFREVRCVVGQEPTIETNAGVSGIIEFNPVRIIPILVGQGLAIAGHKLGDQHLATRGRECAEAQADNQQSIEQ